MSVYQRHYEKVVMSLDSLTRIVPLTIGEIFYFSLFLLNFIAGKTMSAVSPAEEVNNYYNNKNNILNQVFVKQGWGWTTFYIVLFYILVAYKNGKKGRSQRLQPGQIVLAIIRWIAVTGWWYLFTQWCFGPPIMDKIFLRSGGYCSVDYDLSTSNMFNLFALGETGFHQSKKVTSQQCRRLRGTWEGGHDPSGHAFLLVHALLYLFLEGNEVWEGWSVLYDNIVKLRDQWRVGKPLEVIGNFIVENPHVILFQLQLLWWFMLLMTNIYFHSVYEKLAGLLFGYFGILVVYVAPRVLLQSRVSRYGHRLGEGDLDKND